MPGLLAVTAFFWLTYCLADEDSEGRKTLKALAVGGTLGNVAIAALMLFGV